MQESLKHIYQWDNRDWHFACTHEISSYIPSGFNPCKHILNMDASIACKGWDQMQKYATCDSRKVIEKAVMLTILTGDWERKGMPCSLFPMLLVRLYV